MKRRWVNFFFYAINVLDRQPLVVAVPVALMKGRRDFSFCSTDMFVDLHRTWEATGGTDGQGTGNDFQSQTMSLQDTLSTRSEDPHSCGDHSFVLEEQEESVGAQHYFVAVEPWAANLAVAVLGNFSVVVQQVVEEEGAATVLATDDCFHLKY